jgi:hypothetical protein
MMETQSEGATMPSHARVQQQKSCVTAVINARARNDIEPKIRAVRGGYTAHAASSGVRERCGMKHRTASWAMSDGEWRNIMEDRLTLMHELS